MQGARAAIRILRGERPETIPPQVFEAGAPVFDWRELQRWGVSEARLPTGSVIQFRQPGFWELYRWPIAGVVLFCLLQAALIIALLVNRAKRRRGEAEATLIADSSSKFVNLPASEVDREIEDALRRVCEFLGIDLAVLWQWSAGAPGVFTPTHAYPSRKGPQPPDAGTQEHYPWVVEQMRAGRMVVLATLEELPSEAVVDRESARLAGGTLGWRGPWGTTYPANLRLLFQEMTEEQWVQTAKEIQRRPPMWGPHGNPFGAADLKGE